VPEVTLPGNTAVTRLLWEDGRFTIDYDNDTSHLPAPPREPMRGIPGKSGQSWDLWFAPFDPAGGRERYIDAYRDAWAFAHGSLQGFDETACVLAAESYARCDPRAVTAAWRGEDFAGLLTLDLRRGRRWGEGWIAFLWVSPELRGHGCGMQLLGEAVALYRGLGRRALRLSVAPSNPAMAFYRKAGFVRVDTQPGAIEPLAVMELPL
jgi:probable phosphoglycerate mutase